MDFVISWEGTPEDVAVATSGAADVDDLDAMTQELLGDPRFRQGMRVLLDHTAASWSGLSGEEIRRRADQLVEDAERIGSQRVAFVVSRPADYGMGRMLESVLHEKTAIVSRVFYSLDEARTWLAEPDAEDAAT